MPTRRLPPLEATCLQQTAAHSEQFPGIMRPQKTWPGGLLLLLSVAILLLLTGSAAAGHALLAQPALAVASQSGDQSRMESWTAIRSSGLFGLDGNAMIGSVRRLGEVVRREQRPSSAGSRGLSGESDDDAPIAQPRNKARSILIRSPVWPPTGRRLVPLLLAAAA